MTQKHPRVESRNESFVARTQTRIWQEQADAANPFLAISSRCHGYDLTELMQSRSFTDVFYLLFHGELPNKAQAQLLQQLMIALINPGPRHPATRAAMNAGVGKSESVHILPIALSVMGGTFNGAGCIEDTMRFLRKHKNKDPQETAQQLLQATSKPEQGDWQIVAGFGTTFGDADVMTQSIANTLLQLPAAGACMRWSQGFVDELSKHRLGWHRSGLAAAVLADLGFQPRMGAGLYQIMSAPGLFAHGIELANKPTTAMPFVKDEDYVIE